jgi:D-arabinose 1-dehydrogenase-like Zn-dependent alcohol dehydrogenase
MTTNQKMKALLFRKPGAALELTEIDIPKPGKRQVRIKVEACGVCHSDLVTQQNLFGNTEYPRVPGHEVVGTIESFGPEGGADVEVWKIGQRVGVGWDGGHCFRCSPCRQGVFSCCENLKIPGLSYDGGYAEYMIAPLEALARLPDEFSFAEAAPLLCAGVTTFNALRNSGARPGDVVAIQGIGGLGHLAVQFAHRAGFHTVAISRGEDSEKTARELGAHLYINTEKQNAVKELNALGGAKVILATAPNAKAMSELVDGLSLNGKLITIGVDPGKLEVSPLQLIPKQKTITGWASGSSKDSEDTLEFCALTGVRPMIERFPVEKGTEAYARMVSGKAKYRAVITFQ